MDGQIGTVALNRAQLARLQPDMVELNTLLQHMAPRCEKDTADAWKIFNDLLGVLKKFAGMDHKAAKRARYRVAGKSRGVSSL